MRCLTLEKSSKAVFPINRNTAIHMRYTQSPSAEDFIAPLVLSVTVQIICCNNELKQKNEKFTQIGVDRYNSKCYTNACRFDRETFEHEKHGKCLLLRRQNLSGSPFFQQQLKSRMKRKIKKLLTNRKQHDIISKLPLRATTKYLDK